MIAAHGRRQAAALQVASPLRQADPRTKLALALIVSLAVMLPVGKLLPALAIYLVLLGWARLLPTAAYRLWRLKWILVVLFLVDWWLVSLELAVLITLRIALLSGSFALLFATTTPGEFRLALEWLGLPHRYCFSIGVAFQSLELLRGEWQAIQEAQQARGAWTPPRNWRDLPRQLHNLIALSVPAIVLTTQRAWSLTEAAYARGFDSPSRRSIKRLHMQKLDWLLLGGLNLLGSLLLLWR